MNRLRPYCNTWFCSIVGQPTRRISKRQTDRDKPLPYPYIIHPRFFCKALHLLRFKFISSKMTLFTHVLLLYLRSKSGDVFFQSKLPTSRGYGSNPKWEASPLSLDWTYLCGKFFLKFPPWKPLPEKNSAAVPIPMEKIFLPVCEVLATATGIYWDCARAIQQKKTRKWKTFQ